MFELSSMAHEAIFAKWIVRTQAAGGGLGG